MLGDLVNGMVEGIPDFVNDNEVVGVTHGDDERVIVIDGVLVNG